jgi:hypothetical protein
VKEEKAHLVQLKIKNEMEYRFDLIGLREVERQLGSENSSIALDTLRELVLIYMDKHDSPQRKKSVCETLAKMGILVPIDKISEGFEQLNS